MGLDLKNLLMGLLFFFWSWVALSQGTSIPGPCVKISASLILKTAKRSMEESNILVEMAQAATKNQGGSKAIKGIKGLKVKDIRPPNMTVSFVNNMGLCMEVISQITIAGKSFIGGTMEITVRSKMITISKMIVEKDGLDFKVTKCSVELLSCKTNLPSSMLPKIVNKFLNSTLGKVLPGMMCPAADKVVGELKKRMTALWVPMEIHLRGIIKYSVSGPPKITTDHASLCFRTEITSSNGENIEISPDPPASNDLPESGKNSSEMTMPVNDLNAAMNLYKLDIDLDFTSDTAEVGLLISVEVIKERIPTLELPETTSDLKYKMRCPDTPTWTLEEGAATLTIHLSIELVAGPQEDSVFSLTVVLKTLGTFKVMGGELHCDLGDSSLENLQETSTKLGEFDPETLSSYMLELIKVTTIPAMKKALEDRIPLPNMMGSDYEETTLEIHENTLRAVIESD